MRLQPDCLLWVAVFLKSEAPVLKNTWIFPRSHIIYSTVPLTDSDAGITSAIFYWKAAQNENLREFRYSAFSCFVFWHLCMNNSLMGKWKKKKGKRYKSFLLSCTKCRRGSFQNKTSSSKYMHIHNSTDKELYSWHLTFLWGFCNKHS